MTLIISVYFYNKYYMMLVVLGYFHYLYLNYMKVIVFENIYY